MKQDELPKRLVELFYPLVELTVFDADGAILEVSNAFSTLKEDQECDLGKSGSLFQELLGTGRSVRTLIDPLDKGAMRLRFDLTYFKNLQQQLNFLVGSPATENTDLWKDMMDRIILDYLQENKVNIEAISGKQKRMIITKLHEKGLFDFKESTSYIASKLKISRATIYNYLKTAAGFRKVHVHQVDAFTREKFGGNPAGVVLDADDLDESIMRKIARELNLSETAFVLPSKKKDFHLRYFTPTGHEIAFCGHSTVGALFMIAKEKRFGIEKQGSFKFTVETLAGTLNMEIAVDKEEKIKVAYEAPLIKLASSQITHEMALDAAGIPADLIDTSYPVMFEKTNQDLFMVAKSLKDLEKIECDARGFSLFSKQHGIVALCVVALEAIEKKNQFHMRCFAPLVGINEDPFTGSVLGGLAAYLDSYKLLPKGATRFRVEQGHFIGRPGVVEVEFSKKGGAYHAKVFAEAVHCFSTEINLT